MLYTLGTWEALALQMTHMTAVYTKQLARHIGKLMTGLGENDTQQVQG